MKRESIVQIARVTKNERTFLRNFEVINRIKMYEKMRDNFKYSLFLYGFTVLSLFTRLKPVALTLSFFSLFVTLFISLAYMVNKFNVNSLIKKMNATGVDFELDSESNFNSLINDPISFIDNYFFEIDSENLNLAVLYFNTKLSIEPDNTLYLSYLKQISKRAEEINKRRLENRLVLSDILNKDEGLVRHIDINECELTEEEELELKSIKESEQKIGLCSKKLQEAKKWYNSLRIGKKY